MTTVRRGHFMCIVRREHFSLYCHNKTTQCVLIEEDIFWDSSVIIVTGVTWVMWASSCRRRGLKAKCSEQLLINVCFRVATPRRSIWMLVHQDLCHRADDARPDLAYSQRRQCRATQYHPHCATSTRCAGCASSAQPGLLFALTDARPAGHHWGLPHVLVLTPTQLTGNWKWE